MYKPFYIGYLPKMDPSLARWSKWVLAGFIVIAIAAGFTFSTQQKDFNDGVFEFGKLTKLDGILIKDPYPMLVLEHGRNFWGKPQYQGILLVGFGKRGALSVVEEMEAFNELDLENREVTLEGTLIYYDGKTLMELTEKKFSLLEYGNIRKDIPTYYVPQAASFSGEIIDPKCYFGVMKPGEGRLHAACAFRCISGGIPPVLKTGETSSKYMLVDYHLDGELKDQILSSVGQSSDWRGKTYQYFGWEVLSIEK